MPGHSNPTGFFLIHVFRKKIVSYQAHLAVEKKLNGLDCNIIYNFINK